VADLQEHRAKGQAASITAASVSCKDFIEAGTGLGPHLDIRRHGLE